MLVTVTDLDHEITSTAELAFSVKNIPNAEEEPTLVIEFTP